MSTDQEDNFIHVEMSTTRFVGTSPIGYQLVDLFCRHGGIYLPEKWDTEERARLREKFDCSSPTALIENWVRPAAWNSIFFAGRRPPTVQMSIDIKRSSHAKFNDFYAFIHENHFKNVNEEQALVKFAIDISQIFHTDYGYIAHRKQQRRQSAVLTPAERLPGIYWANFFGRPYIDFFGREKLLATPCYEVRQINDDLILLLTAERLTAPDVIGNDVVVNRVKAYLNQNAFAGPNFPEEKCAVPAFDFSELRTIDEQKQTPEESLRELREKLLAQGSELIEETEDRLVLRNSEGFVILVDKRSKEVSVDATGQYPLSRK